MTNSSSSAQRAPAPLNRLLALLEEAHEAFAALPVEDAEALWSFLELLLPSLPNFGGTPVPRDDHVWSWDESQILVGDRGSGFFVVAREATFRRFFEGLSCPRSWSDWPSGATCGISKTTGVNVLLGPEIADAGLIGGDGTLWAGD